MSGKAKIIPVHALEMSLASVLISVIVVLEPIHQGLYKEL